MNLDNEVAKLRMLKAEHRSQHYRLEDDLLKRFPEQITAVTERIAGIEKDITLYTAEKEKCVIVQQSAAGNASVSTKFPGMTVGGVFYSEKEPAAKALLESCKGIRGKHTDFSAGEYMGFKMSLHYESYGHQINLLLRGAMTYQIELGTDALGNITRINNALDKLPERLSSAKSTLENLHKQVEAAKLELVKPFEQEAELDEKEARLALLNADLNIDGDGDINIVNDTNSYDERGEDSIDEPVGEAYGGDEAYGGGEAHGGEEPGGVFAGDERSCNSGDIERVHKAASVKSKPSILDSIRTFNSSKHNSVPDNTKPTEHII